MQRLTPYYYSFSAAAADINRDGHMDVISGPFIFYGPEFNEAREFYAAQTSSPSTTFQQNWVAFAGDFTGDVWPDILLASTDNNRLYVNPKGEARRWDGYPNVIPPANQSEISMMKDLDGDGKPELIYASAGAVRLARPDPAHPTGPWLSTQVGEPGSYTAHGIGAGDLNRDGRPDILNPTGWWEQPPEGLGQPMWKYHPAVFGRGGAEMVVYDVNGDGLSDVVTSMQAHGSSRRATPPARSRLSSTRSPGTSRRTTPVTSRSPSRTVPRRPTSIRTAFPTSSSASDSSPTSRATSIPIRMARPSSMSIARSATRRRRVVRSSYRNWSTIGRAPVRRCSPWT
jgi:hypothetical protein